MTQVTIVCGAPGSGKTYWATRQMKWGDLMLDIDLMFEAITGLPMYDKPLPLLPVVLAMRDAVLAQLARPNQVQRAFIITATTKHSEIAAMVRKTGARVVVMETSSLMCLKRISTDERRCNKLEQWQALVQRWFRDWRDYPGAEVVK